MTMNWTSIWLKIFGTTTLWGFNMGFWVSLSAVFLIVLLMNLIFWSIKPSSRIPRKGAMIFTDQIRR